MKWLAGLVSVLLLAGCGGRPEAPSLKVAAWNIEHLAERDGEGCRPRTEADYAAARRQVKGMDADVVAFQEVQSEAAARRVFDPGKYVIVIEDRAPGAQRPCSARHAGNRRTPTMVGFAIRRDLAFTRAPDLTALSVGDSERPHGVDITVRPAGGRPLRLLAVHLQVGCAVDKADPRCAELFRQQAVLRDWIAARVAAGERFAIAGDFNRELARPGDRFWAGLTDNGRLPVATAAGKRATFCGRSRRQFIDHVLVGGAAREDLSGFSERLFMPFSNKPSDHCPVRATIRA